MSATGGLIVYKINGWKITTMEIRGVLEHPPGYAPEWKGLKDILKNVFIQQKTHIN